MATTELGTVIGTALADLGCPAATAERIGEQTIHEYLTELDNPKPDDLADLPADSRGVAGYIVFHLAGLIREASKPAADLNVACDYAARAVRQAIAAAEKHEAEHSPNWGPLEAAIPQSELPDWMWMGTLRHNGLVIQQYKHCDTRRYVNLDAHGQAWRVRFHEHRDKPEVDTMPLLAALALARP